MKTPEWLQGLVDQARALRLSAEQSSARFLLYVMSIEGEHLDRLLTECAYRDFAGFIRTWELCDYARYERFKRGVEALGSADLAEEAGEFATRAAGSMKPADVPRYAKNVRAWIETHSGVKPSQQAANRIRLQSSSSPEEPRSSHQVSELSKLRAENQTLRADVRSLESKLRKAEERADKAERQLAKLKSKRNGADQPTA